MYDANSPETFKKAEEWVEQLRKCTEEGMPIVIVGDDPGERKIPEKEVLEYLYNVYPPA